MAVGLNNKVNFDRSRYQYDDVGYTKFDFRPATKPALFLNFLENPSATEHGATITVSRAGATATYFDANKILQTASANTARFNHNNVTGACLGLLVESAGTNLMLRSRDLSNAAWDTQTNVTVAVDQVGLDGATSASSVLSTASNAVITQSITSASAARVFSAYVKRLVGTGTISITLDGGATYTDVTSQLSVNHFVRVQAAQTLANPAVGFKISTSGDKIAVDYCQCESNTVATSPILSVGAQGSRQADNISITTLTPWFSATAGTVYAEATSASGDTGVNQYVCILDDGTANERIILFRATSTNAPTFFVTDGGVTQVTLNTGSWAASTTKKFASVYKANDCAMSYAGATIQTDTSATLPTVTTFRLGVSQSNTSHLNGYIRRIAIWDVRLANAYLVNMAT